MQRVRNWIFITLTLTLLVPSSTWAQSKTIKALMAQADAGDPVAQNSLGSAYQTGKGISQDDDEAFEWFTKSAQQGLPIAQYNLGFLYYRGTGVQQDFKEALQWIGKAASQGFAVAQFAVAGFYYRGSGGLPVNHDEAFFWYQKAAAQGYPPAQYLLGLMFFYGNGVEQDYIRATAWLELAAKKGEKGAAQARDKATQFLDGEQSFKALQFAGAFQPISQDEAKGPEPTLGLDRFPTSSGVLVAGPKTKEETNPAEPRQNRMAAASPDSLAIPTRDPNAPVPSPTVEAPPAPAPSEPGILSSLKKLFSPGPDSTTSVQPETASTPPAVSKTTGLPAMKPVTAPKVNLPPPPTSAGGLNELLANAKAGDPKAQYDVALLFTRGSMGAKQDYTTAIQWLTKSADAGHVPAQRTLGLLHLHGRGVTKNLTYAVQRFGQAALTGDTDSQYWLGEIYEKSDDVESLRWYRMAADKGHSPSQLALGRMFAGGQGASQNYIEAAKWLELAAGQSGTEALNLLKTLHQFMSLEETNEARRRAQAFTPTGK